MRNDLIGFVFQNFNLLARTSALDNVTMPLNYAREAVLESAMKERAAAAAEIGGAGGADGSPAFAAFGRQQQRVAIARALVNRPRLLLADEPTGNLDSRTSEEILGMFRRLNESEGLTVILVTHDAHVAEHAKRVIRIRDGLIEGPGGGGGDADRLAMTLWRPSSWRCGRCGET